MSIRGSEIGKHLTRWLDRYTVPLHLRENPKASQSEAEALARILCKFAPVVDYEAFLIQASMIRISMHKPASGQLSRNLLRPAPMSSSAL